MDLVEIGINLVVVVCLRRLHNEPIPFQKCYLLAVPSLGRAMNLWKLEENVGVCVVQGDIFLSGRNYSNV